MTFITRLSVALAGALVLGGCFNLGDGGGCTPTSNGLTGNGNFTYECIGSSDPRCDDGANPTSFSGTPALPQAVARGATFGLRYNGEPPEAVSTKTVEKKGRNFIPLTTGQIGFVVLAGAEAVDAVRLKVVEPTSITIDGRRSTVGEVGEVVRTSWMLWDHWSGAQTHSMNVGDASKLRVAAYGDGQPLAGAMTKTKWDINPEGAAKIFEYAEGTIELTPLKPGPLSVTAHLGELLATADFEIHAKTSELDGGEDPDASDGGTVDLDAGDAGGDQ